MLVDTLNEQRTGAQVAPGLFFDELLKPFLRRLAKAQVFVLSPEVVAMSANVSLSKPSSILASLPWVRLPFDSVWIEYSAEQLSQAMADLGSPNLTPPGTAGRVQRAGFLVRQEDTKLVLEFVHLLQTERGTFADLCSIRGRFDLSDIVGPTEASTIRSELPDAVKGRVRESLRLISKDPREAAARDEIDRRFEWEMHPDMEAASDAVAQRSGLAAVVSIHEGWLGEMRRAFYMLLLPSLILLNTKNAVRQDDGPSLDKLNKHRVKKGRQPLVEHKMLVMHLTAAQRRAAAEAGDGGRAIKGALVIGHFKQRATGLFWWHHHHRHGYGATHQVARQVRL